MCTLCNLTAHERQLLIRALHSHLVLTVQRREQSRAACPVDLRDNFDDITAYLVERVVALKRKLK